MTEPIVDAVKAGDVGKVRRLLEESPGLLDAKTPEGSLLLTAVYHGAAEVAALLAARMPALNVFEAAAVGDGRRLQELLEADARLANAAGEGGFTPLGLAAFFGHEEAARVLLDRGADADRVMENANANTALDAAVAADHLDVVKRLLGAGANVNVQATRGYSPLHKAAFGGNPEMVRLLLDGGADPHLETDEGRRALDIAVERGHEDAAAALRAHTG